MAGLTDKPLVAGRNIYIHNKKTIYYDRLTDQNYIIRNENVRAYNYLSIRHFLAFAFGYTGAILTSNFWIGLVIGLGIWGVMSYVFYKRYLPKLAVDEGFKRPKTIPYTDSLAQRLSYGRLLSAFLVSLMLAFVVVFNAIVNQYDTVVLVLNFVLAAGAAALAFACLIAFFKKRKAENQ